LPEFPQTCPKRFCATFAYKFPPTKIVKTFFGMTSKKGLHVFFCKRWAPFCESKQRWAPLLFGFLESLPRFLGISPRFSGILPGFSEILPKFLTNQNFWRCACTPCTPASYITVRRCLLCSTVYLTFAVIEEVI